MNDPRVEPHGREQGYRVREKQTAIVVPPLTESGERSKLDPQRGRGICSGNQCFNHALSLLRIDSSYKKVKVNASHTPYRALGPELIPVYRQSARR